MFRTLLDTDYRACKLLFTDVFQLTEDPAFVEAWRKRITQASWAFIMHGTLVGASIVTQAGDGPKLEYLFVSEAFQHQGIGGALLEHTVDTVFDTSDRLYLMPAIDNVPLEQWYASRGFEWADPRRRTRLMVRFRSLRRLVRNVARTSSKPFAFVA